MYSNGGVYAGYIRNNRRGDKMDNVKRTLEAIAEEFCNEYCKWPGQYVPEEHGDVDLCESEICANCPVMKLT